MPPLVFSPLGKIVLGALGGALVGWVVKEVRRLDGELAAMQTAIDPLARQGLPTLRRDPHTGEWRVS